MKALKCFIVAVLAMVYLCSMGNSASAKVSQSEYFATNNGKLLVKITTETRVGEVMTMPKIPKGVSIQEALALFSGKVLPEKKECTSFYTGLTNGIRVSKECEITKKTLQPTYDNQFHVVVALEKVSKTPSIWMYIWPVLSIVGIFSLAIIFIATNASAKFMLHYGAVTAMEFMAIDMIDGVIFDLFLKSIIVIIVWLAVIILIYATKVDLFEHWKDNCSKLKFVDSSPTTSYACIFLMWTFLGQLVPLFILAFLPTVAVEIDFGLFFFNWLVFVTVLVAVCNKYFPVIGDKYLSFLR